MSGTPGDGLVIRTVFSYRWNDTPLEAVQWLKKVRPVCLPPLPHLTINLLPLMEKSCIKHSPEKGSTEQVTLPPRLKATARESMPCLTEIELQREESCVTAQVVSRRLLGVKSRG